MQDFTNSFVIVLQEAGTDMADYVPRIMAALLIFIIGAIIARVARGLTVKILESLRVSSALKKTPLEHFAKDANIGEKVEEVVGGVVYWIIMLIVIQSTVSVLGLTSLSDILDKILGYLPNVISAVIILLFGILLAGLVESLVKGAMKTVDARTGRALGKISSYLVVSIAVMIAISELGIAQEYILILFIGFVSMITLGFGLAVGLGGKDLIKKLLEKWYTRVEDEIQGDS